MTSRIRLVAVGMSVLALGSLGLVAGGPAAADLDQWEPPQVVDPAGTDAREPALTSTQHGRAVVVYGRERGVWVSSRAPGADASWAAPQRLDNAPRGSVAGPLATGSGGGATVFLANKGFFAHMSPTGQWGDARPFPYQDLFTPAKAIARPVSGVVTVGTTGYGRVRAAVKPSHEPWQLSPGLDLGYAVARGLWYGGAGRVHLLVAQHAHADRHSRDLFEVVLHRHQGDLVWGPLRPLRSGGGTLASVRDVSVLNTADGAITVLWQEYDAQFPFRLRQLVRHRDAAGDWSPIRRLPVPALPALVGALDDNGTTRLSYVTRITDSRAYQVITRKLLPDGALTDPVQLDGPIPHDAFPNLDGATAPGGALLLRWRSIGDDTVEQHFFRCLPGADCASVGSVVGPREVSRFSLLAVTPAGAALVAGVDAVEGCPAGQLCSRRLPPS